ncbi:MAG: hypothetical protein IJL93_01235 [Bacteroidales bacterium]|nr:hypothetical protein [Bacteroidales bacterium]
MFEANGGFSGGYNGLNTALTAVGGDRLEGNDRYWTATPEFPGSSYYYWYLKEGSFTVSYADVAETYRVRACLLF